MHASVSMRVCMHASVSMRVCMHASVSMRVCMHTHTMFKCMQYTDLFHPIQDFGVNVPLPPEVKVHSIHPSIEGGVSSLEAVAVPE